MDNKPVDSIVYFPLESKGIFFRHSLHSYAKIVYTLSGDLFMQTDYGTFTMSWRSFGDDFEIFLTECTSDYILLKFLANTENDRELKKNYINHVQPLIEEFQKYLKTIIEKRTIRPDGGNCVQDDSQK